MNDVVVGRAFRSVRHRLGQRQQEVAVRARLSRQVVSRIETGRLEDVSVTSLRAVATALGIRLELVARWRGGELERLLNRRHAAMREAALALFGAVMGWETVSELSFNVWGERGVIDLAGWHPVRRSLVLTELKSEFVDPGELVGTMDRRRRLAIDIAKSRGWRPRVVALWVIVADTRTNRRHLAASGRLLRGAFPADGHAMRRWLRDPARPIAALSFLTPARDTGARGRVSRTRTVGNGAQGPSDPCGARTMPSDRRRRAGRALKEPVPPASAHQESK